MQRNYGDGDEVNVKKINAFNYCTFSFNPFVCVLCVSYLKKCVPLSLFTYSLIKRTLCIYERSDFLSEISLTKCMIDKNFIL